MFLKISGKSIHFLDDILSTAFLMNSREGTILTGKIIKDIKCNNDFKHI